MWWLSSAYHIINTKGADRAEIYDERHFLPDAPIVWNALPFVILYNTTYTHPISLGGFSHDYRNVLNDK